jgi:hypothetical protein
VNSLAIVGSHPRTRDNAPWDDPNVDIWAFNEVLSNKYNNEKGSFCKRATGIFQMHLPAIWKNPLNRSDAKHYEWLKTQTEAEIFMLDQYPEIPRCTAYPFKAITDALLPTLTIDSEMHRKEFFTCTVAYALALGIYRGYKKIDVYGAELETLSEYQYQRDSTCFWMGVAAGRGVDITIHSQMLDVPIYGMESFITIDKQKFIDNIARYSPQCDQAKQNYQTSKDGADALYRDLEERDSVKDALEKAIFARAQAGQIFGILDGSRQENERYLARAKAMETASGHYVFSKHEFLKDISAIKTEREKVILQWSQVAGKCQTLMASIIGKKSRARREIYKELGAAIEQYIKLAVQIGMYTGGAEEDDRLSKLMDEVKQ